MPAKASYHGWPCCTLARISAEPCRIATQHWARRPGRPIARRCATSGSEAGDGSVTSGCADLRLSARRQATRVDICCAITIRTSPQIGFSLGHIGQRQDSDAITRAKVESRDDKSDSGEGTEPPPSEARRASFVSFTSASYPGSQRRQAGPELGRIQQSLCRSACRQPWGAIWSHSALIPLGGSRCRLS